MAPSPATEDYYAILEVEQLATLELITKSYKQLAKKLHPDRNNNHDTTAAFQSVGQAPWQVPPFSVPATQCPH